MTFTILPVSAALALLITAITAYALGRRLRRKLPAILVAGLALPLTMFAAALYDVSTEEPDGPPPGMVLLGVLAISAAVTPVTLTVSWLTVRYAHH